MKYCLFTVNILIIAMCYIIHIPTSKRYFIIGLLFTHIILCTRLIIIIMFHYVWKYNIRIYIYTSCAMQVLHTIVIERET